MSEEQRLWAPEQARTVEPGERQGAKFPPESRVKAAQMETRGCQCGSQDGKAGVSTEQVVQSSTCTWILALPLSNSEITGP